jgi:hypothetical protein
MRNDKHALKSRIAKCRRARRTFSFCIFHGVFFMCYVAVQGCAPNRAPAVRYIEQADQLHAQALASTIIPDEDLNAYIQEIGKRLEQAARDEVPDKARGPFFQNLQFHLVDSPIVNCYMTGGSHVYVYRGLLDFCRSEEELAAGIAHAYAHALNLDFEATKLKPPAKPQPTREVAWDFVTTRFTVQQERNADRLAFRLYARAGWDPAHFEDLFGRLSDQYPEGPAADRDPLPRRAELARGLVAGVPKKWHQLPVADPRTFDALRKQAGSLRFSSPASNDARLYLLAFPNCILSQDLDVQKQAQDKLRPPPPPPVQVEPS